MFRLQWPRHDKKIKHWSIVQRRSRSQLRAPNGGKTKELAKKSAFPIVGDEPTYTNMRHVAFYALTFNDRRQHSKGAHYEPTSYSLPVHHRDIIYSPTGRRHEPESQAATRRHLAAHIVGAGYA